MHGVKLEADQESGPVQRFYQRLTGPAGTKVCVYAKLKDQKKLVTQSEVCVTSSG